MSSGIIYKIFDNTNDNVYYGSTTRELRFRKAEHKNQYKQYCDGVRTFTTCYDILKNNDWGIEIVEKCSSGLRERERWFIENNKCVNKRIEGRTLNEYYVDVLKPHRQSLAYYCETCNCNVIIGEKSRHEKTNKHLGIPKKKREITKSNKDIIICECGLNYTRAHKLRHQNSKKHLSFSL